MTYVPSTLKTCKISITWSIWKLKPYLPIDGSASGISVEELDLKLQQSWDEVMSIQDSLNTSISDLSVQLQTMTTRMEK
jgi:hypothetical protein